MKQKKSNETYSEKNIDNNLIISEIMSTTLGIPGVSSMASTLTDTIMSIPGKNNNKKGIKVAHNDLTLIIDIHVKVYFNTKIPQIAWDIQRAVKNMLLNKFKISVKAVNIHVDGVEYPGN